MTEFTAVAHQAWLSPGAALMTCIWTGVSDEELRGDHRLLKNARVKDRTLAKDAFCSGVYHLLVEDGSGTVSTFSGRYLIGKATKGTQGAKPLLFSRAVPEMRAPVQDSMPHRWLSQLSPLPVLMAPVPQRVTALKAQRRELEARAPVPEEAVADLSRTITGLDPYDHARSSRAAVTLRAAHLAQFVPGVRFTIARLVDLQGRPHPEPVTLLQSQGNTVLVLSKDAQGLSLDAAHLAQATVVAP